MVWERALLASSPGFNKAGDETKRVHVACKALPVAAPGQELPTNSRHSPKRVFMATIIDTQSTVQSTTQNQCIHTVIAIVLHTMQVT